VTCARHDLPWHHRSALDPELPRAKEVIPFLIIIGVLIVLGLIGRRLVAVADETATKATDEVLFPRG